jgi:hypothetical protein
MRQLNEREYDMGLFSKKAKNTIHDLLAPEQEYLVLHRAQLHALSAPAQHELVKALGEAKAVGSEAEYYIRRRGSNGRFSKA